MVAIGVGQTVEVLKSGERGVIFDIITDDGSWAVGVLFGEDEARYFRTNELDFIED
jgi:hypothetical protein